MSCSFKSRYIEATFKQDWEVTYLCFVYIPQTAIVSRYDLCSCVAGISGKIIFGFDIQKTERRSLNIRAWLKDNHDFMIP